MKQTDLVKFQGNDVEKGRIIRVGKKGKLVVAITVDPADVLECTPRTYKRGTKNAANKSADNKS